MSDLRIGLRLLLKDKTFTLASVATLAICVAANVVLFSIVDHVLLEPLPWPNASRIVQMGNQYPGAGGCCGTANGVPDYFDRLRETTVFDEQAMYQWTTATIDQHGTPARVLTMRVTPSFFRVVSTSAALGRTFTDDEGEIGHEHEAVLSYGLWQAMYGGDRGVIGRDVPIDGESYTIVGVMPRTFSYLDGNTPDRITALWRPLVFTPQQKADDARHSNNWQHIARLKPGATVRQAQEQINLLNARNLDRFPQFRELLINAGFRTDVARLQDNLVRDVKPTLFWLWGGALFVLLIGAVNVANLLLVRTSARLRELVTCMARGSGRLRIARQLTVENVVLTTVSSAIGVALAFAALRLLAVVNLLDLPRGSEIRIDAAVGAYAIAIAVVVGVALAAVPFARVFSANMAQVLTEQGRSGTSGRATRLLRRAFVVVQVAFAFVLLAGAGLLFASFRRVLAVDPGFSVDHVLTASIAVPQTRDSNDAAVRAFQDDALGRLRGIAGVASVGATDTIPFAGPGNQNLILAEGYRMQPGESIISPVTAAVSPGYFETMRAHLMRGRFFDERDGADAPKVAVVDERLAKKFWPNQDPVGRRLFYPTDPTDLLAVTGKTVFITVVGLVHDMKIASLVDNAGNVGSVFMPLDQMTRRNVVFAVRTAADPLAVAGQVRATIAGLDREMAVYNVEAMSTRLDRSLTSRRSPMLLAAAFGAIALLLSAIGVYGVLAFLVTQRTKEIGIRLALGSSTSAVFQLILREGLTLVALGFVAGALAGC